jgi:ankyrin repeat protein
MDAAWFGKAQVVEIMLEHRADPNARTKLGDSVLHIAAQDAATTRSPGSC